MSDLYSYKVTLDIADELISMDLQNQGTIIRLGDFVKDSVLVNEKSLYYDVIRDYQKTYKLSPKDAEFYTCISLVSDMLLPEACIFHGAAFIWDGLAYILTAPSGTGKTTQLMNWIRLLGEDVSIINGDKPALRVCSDHTVMVYPSPWNGKENLHGDQKGKLAGVIYLKQDLQNSIHLCTPKEAAALLFSQVFSLVDHAESVHAIASFTENLFKAVPVWLLSNKGDLDSTILTRETILAYQEGNHHE